jgi:hypothetical protein
VCLPLELFVGVQRICSGRNDGVVLIWGREGDHYDMAVNTEIPSIYSRRKQTLHGCKHNNHSRWRGKMHGNIKIPF